MEPAIDVRPFAATAEYEAMVDYFLGGSDEFLLGMGVDLARVPSRASWLEAVLADAERPDREKERLFLAWRVEGELVGHSSLSHIEFGRVGHCHLHLWRADLRRSGLGARLVAASIDLYFERFALETLACEPFGDNPGPNRLLAQLGLRLVKRYRCAPTSMASEQCVHRYEIGRGAWRGLAQDGARDGAREGAARAAAEELEQVRRRAFLSPRGENREALEAQVQTLVGDLFEHLSQADTRELLPRGLVATPPAPLLRDDAVPFEGIRASIAQLFRESMNAHATRYMGHMDSMPTVFSVVGDLLASGLNNNLFALEMSPFLTRLEERMAREFCTLFGLPEGSAGLVLSGGSLANLQALTVARNAQLGDRGGDVRAAAQPLAILCSECAHVSLDKAAMVLGLGPGALFKVPCDAAQRMDVTALEATLERARAAGFRPAILVATAGTTVTGSIDPLAELAACARAHDLWLHVDAIWGGGLMLSEKERGLLWGIEQADSISFNPQKWMMVAKTCSLALFRRAADLEQFFRIKKTYVQERDEGITDLSEVGLSGSKHAEVLKLWLSLQSVGLRGYAAYVDHTLSLARHFERRARERPYLRLAAGRDTALVCMRGEPSGLKGAELDAWNRDLATYLLEQKKTFFSLPKQRGGDWLRIVLLNPFLDASVIDAVFEDIDAFERARRRQEPEA